VSAPDAYWEADPEPGLPPTREELEQGLEPEDAVSSHADRPIIEPPEVADELDRAAALLWPAPEPRAEPEPEAGPW
jgi:hypothetical protein